VLACNGRLDDLAARSSRSPHRVTLSLGVVVTAIPGAVTDINRSAIAGSLPQGFSALDVLTATYTACSATVLLVRHLVGDQGVSQSELRWLLVAHALLIALVLLARQARLAAAPRYSVLAEWYPVLILSAIYASIGLVNGPREALGLSGDPLVLHWESRLAGPQYLDRWAGHDGPPIVNWGLAVSYLAFFPMVIAAPMVLWLQGQRARARRAIFGITFTFLTCYLVFLLFPVAGPAYVQGWPTTQAGSDLPVRLVRSLNDRGDSWGSAFPSSHVAASAAALMLGMNGCRRLGTVLFPFALGILLAVVYFRVHYVLDAVAGLALATLIVTMLYRFWPLGAERT
jgi:membrane-associated phospholipid phosphatase